MPLKRVLCVCTAGEQRSPTCARLLNETDMFEAKSAGIHPFAHNRARQRMIDWADIILAMNEEEDGHLTHLESHFNLNDTPVHVLDIEDRYLRDDPELVALLKEKLRELFPKVRFIE